MLFSTSGAFWLSTASYTCSSFLYSSCIMNSFVFFAVHETRRIFLSPFISKSTRRVSSFFLRVQLSPAYTATGHTTVLSGTLRGDVAYDSAAMRHFASLLWPLVGCCVGEVLDVSQVGRGVDGDGTLNVDIIISGQVPEIDRDASIDLLPYSELYIQTGPGTYSHVRVSVCLSVCQWTSYRDR